MMDPIGTAVLVIYIAALLLLGLWASRRSRSDPEDFFVASRNLGPFVLFATLAATNFSAFTFFGFAGAAYRLGYAYYGIMAVGTSMMAFSFFLIGRKVWRLGKEKGYITPPELIGGLTGSEGLRTLYLLVMVVFTMPYLATQAVGGGIAVENLTDGAVSYEVGAVVVTLVITAYVLKGGMRTDAITDVLQGLLMVVTMVSAVGIVAWGLGGFGPAIARIGADHPGLTGGDGFPWQMWVSYIVLWTFADPMFPQLFARFYAARNENALRRSMIAYPLIVGTLFMGPVLIGVWGNISLPGLDPIGSDSVLPSMVAEHGTSFLTGTVLAGAFAALMSTADSQLLVLSSMLTRDVYSRWIRPGSSPKGELLTGKVLVVVLAGIGLSIALFRVDSIFEALTKTTFSGLALLFPSTVAVLYWKRVSARGCISSILSGGAVYGLMYADIIPDRFSYGFLEIVPALIVSITVLIVVSLLAPSRAKDVEPRLERTLASKGARSNDGRGAASYINRRGRSGYDVP